MLSSRTALRSNTATLNCLRIAVTRHEPLASNVSRRPLSISARRQSPGLEDRESSGNRWLNSATSCSGGNPTAAAYPRRNPRRTMPVGHRETSFRSSAASRDSWILVESAISLSVTPRDSRRCLRNGPNASRSVFTRPLANLTDACGASLGLHDPFLNETQHDGDSDEGRRQSPLATAPRACQPVRPRSGDDTPGYDFLQDKRWQPFYTNGLKGGPVYMRFVDDRVWGQVRLPELTR